MISIVQHLLQGTDGKCFILKYVHKKKETENKNKNKIYTCSGKYVTAIHCLKKLQ